METMEHTVKTSFPVTGMSCAACAGSVESMLQAQPDVVSAAVNFASSSVLVEYVPEKADPAAWKKAIQSVGYDLLTENMESGLEDHQRHHYHNLKQRTIWAVIFSLPLVVIGMFFMDMPYGNWIMWALATPVVLVLGRQFFINAWKQARMGKANMDTLVALSTGIAYIFSGQAPDRIAAVLPDDRRLENRDSKGTIAETILGLLDDHNTSWPILVTTADHALLDTAMVDEFCTASESSDIAIGVVENSNMLRRLPETVRTWFWLGREGFTGANLFALRSPAVRPAIEIWRTFEQERKKPWRIFSILGPGDLIAVLFRLVGLEGAMARLSKRLGLQVKAVRLSNPLAGVDVDKAEDHALAEAIIAGKA